MEKKEYNTRFTIAKIIFVVIVILLLLLFVKSCGNEALNVVSRYTKAYKDSLTLELDEKTYYVLHNSKFALPKAKAYDLKKNPVNIEKTIYKGKEKVSEISTAKIGDKYTVYYKAYKGSMYEKKHINVEIVRNPKLLDFSVEGISNEWTNKDVEITIVPKETNITEYCINTTCNKESKKIIKKNQKFNITIKDENGNTSETKEYEVTNIDKEIPEVKSTKTITKDKKLYLVIEATDNLSGIKEYSFDDGKTWIKESTLEIKDEKKTYRVKTKDNASNISKTYNYKYEKDSEEPKDKIVPTFEIRKTCENGFKNENWCSGNVRVNINATDESGIKAYSFDNGETWINESTFNYTKDNNYNIKIKVKDNLENTSETKEIAFNIDKTAPVINGVENNQTYTSDVTPDIIEKNIESVIFTKNEEEATITPTITEDGLYYIKVTDKAGNEISVIFSILHEDDDRCDDIIISGIENGNITYNNVVLNISGDNDTLDSYVNFGISSIILERYNYINKEYNRVPFYKNRPIVGDGNYKLTVYNNCGESESINFTINKELPKFVLDSNNDQNVVNFRVTSNNLQALAIKDQDDHLIYSTTDTIDFEDMLLIDGSIDISNYESVSLNAIDSGGNQETIIIDGLLKEKPISTVSELEDITYVGLRTINDNKYYLHNFSNYKLVTDIDYQNSIYNISHEVQDIEESDIYVKMNKSLENSSISPYFYNNSYYKFNIEDNTGELDSGELIFDNNINKIVYDLDNGKLYDYENDVIGELLGIYNVFNIEDTEFVIFIKTNSFLGYTMSPTSYMIDLLNVDIQNNILNSTVAGDSVSIHFDENGNVLKYYVNDSLVADLENSSSMGAVLLQYVDGEITNYYFVVYNYEITGIMETYETVLQRGEYLFDYDAENNSAILIYDGVTYDLSCDGGGENGDRSDCYYYSPGYKESIEVDLHVNKSWETNINLKQNGETVLSQQYKDNMFDRYELYNILFYNKTQNIDNLKAFKINDVWYKKDLDSEVIYCYDRINKTWNTTEYTLEGSNPWTYNRYYPVFKGTIDGQKPNSTSEKYKISNIAGMYYDCTEEYSTGIFGFLNSAKISNISFNNINVETEHEGQGGFGLISGSILNSEIDGIEINNLNLEMNNFYEHTIGFNGVITSKAVNSVIKNNKINGIIGTTDGVSPKTAVLIGKAFNTNLINNEVSGTLYGANISGLAVDYYCSNINEGCLIKNNKVDVNFEASNISGLVKTIYQQYDQEYYSGIHYLPDNFEFENAFTGVGVVTVNNNNIILKYDGSLISTPLWNFNNSNVIGISNVQPVSYLDMSTDKKVYINENIVDIVSKNTDNTKIINVSGIGDPSYTGIANSNKININHLSENGVVAAGSSSSNCFSSIDDNTVDIKSNSKKIYGLSYCVNNSNLNSVTINTSGTDQNVYGLGLHASNANNNTIKIGSSVSENVNGNTYGIALIVDDRLTTNSNEENDVVVYNNDISIKTAGIVHGISDINTGTIDSNKIKIDIPSNTTYGKNLLQEINPSYLITKTNYGTIKNFKKVIIDGKEIDFSIGESNLNSITKLPLVERNLGTIKDIEVYGDFLTPLFIVNSHGFTKDDLTTSNSYINNIIIHGRMIGVNYYYIDISNDQNFVNIALLVANHGLVSNINAQIEQTGFQHVDFLLLHTYSGGSTENITSNIFVEGNVDL